MQFHENNFGVSLMTVVGSLTHSALSHSSVLRIQLLQKREYSYFKNVAVRVYALYQDDVDISTIIPLFEGLLLKRRTNDYV